MPKANNIITMAHGSGGVAMKELIDGLFIKEYVNKQESVRISNVDSYIIGSVEQLCAYTKDMCEKLGYHTTIIQSDCVDDVNIVAEKY